MRALAQFEDIKKAHRLGGMLLFEGIENTVEQTRDGFHTVWIIDEPKLDKAKEVLRLFEAAPDDPRFTDMAREGAARHAENLRAAAREDARRTSNRPPALRQSVTILGLGPVTFALIAASVGVYILIEGMHQQAVADALFFAKNVSLATALGSSVPDAVGGQWWRLVTPIFMHAPPGPNFLGLLHIGFNMLWLKDLGTIIERVHGSVLLVVLVLVSAVVSNTAQYVLGGSAAFYGMSGVVYALFGYLWMRGRFDPRVPYRLPTNLVVQMMAWFLLCFTGMLGNVANYCHAGGLIVGGVWGFIAAQQAVRNR